ncbi:MAG: trigger factor [Vampirovibrionales bacterium]|jgi:trigger factor|nr:trigger factor [Vampirovibrionales bacterium]
MKVELQPIESSAVKLTIHVPAEQAQQEFNKACRRVGQRVNIHGFRRGKAPLRMIEKTVGEDVIKQEALDRYLPYVFADVISEQKLDVVAQPRLLELDFNLQKGIRLVAEVDIRPTVNLPEGLALAVDVEKLTPITDAEEKEIQALLERISSLETVTDRTVVEGTDVIVLDFTGRLNGEEFAGGKAEEFELDLSNNNFLDSFTIQLPGKEVGVTFNIDVQFPEDYFDAKLADQVVTFESKIHAIKKYVTPELTDETAPKLGDFKTVADVKAHVAKSIETRNEREETFRKQRAVVDALVQATKIDLPKGMIQREVESIIEDMGQRFQQQGLNFNEFLQNRTEEMTESFKSEAIQRITTSLAFAEIAKVHQVTVTEEDFNQQIAEIAEAQGTDERSILRQLSNQPNGSQALLDQLLAQKVVNILLEKATFTWVEAKEELLQASTETPALEEVATPAE